MSSTQHTAIDTFTDLIPEYPLEDTDGIIQHGDSTTSDYLLIPKAISPADKHAYWLHVNMIGIDRITNDDQYVIDTEIKATKTIPPEFITEAIDSNRIISIPSETRTATNTD